MSADSNTLCKQVTTLIGSLSSMMSPAEHSWERKVGGKLVIVQGPEISLARYEG